MYTPSQKTELIRLIATTLLFFLLLGVSFPLVQTLQKVQVLNQHRAELSNVKYGLLNSESWMQQIAVIVEKKINEFRLTDQNRSEINRAVTRVLDRLLVEVDSRLRKQRLHGSWVDRQLGKLKQLTQDAIIDVDRLRERLPHYTNQILNELDKPESRTEVRKLLLEQMQDFRKAAFTPVDMTLYNSILLYHECNTAPQCKDSIDGQVNVRQHEARLLLVIALLAMALMLVLGMGSRQPIGNARMALLLAGALLMLGMGVATPMLEVSAGISSIQILLFGEPVTFINQTLYFQSKSILEVILLLLTSNRTDWVVAVLIGFFGLILPACKLIASFFYHFDFRHLRNNKIIEIIALKSGKWSMVDVMVIAIIVAYLGFDRMIGSQLDSLIESTHKVEVLTTNGTALQLGFYLFLGYCLASLVIASLIEKSAVEVSS